MKMEISSIFLWIIITMRGSARLCSWEKKWLSTTGTLTTYLNTLLTHGFELSQVESGAAAAGEYASYSRYAG